MRENPWLVFPVLVALFHKKCFTRRETKAYKRSHPTAGKITQSWMTDRRCSMRARRAWFTLALGWAFSAAVLGQTVSTEILGLVTDPTGAVIPGATVTVRRIATGDVRTTTANETGNYIFPLLDRKSVV